MANLISRRLISSVFHRNLMIAPSLVHNRPKSHKLQDPSDQASGLEKMELLKLLAGKDDPYNMKAIQRGVGTKEQPTLIPSSFDARIIGCICDEDQTNVQWMWLNKDTPKQCECGYWFKLYHVEPFEDEPILATNEIR